MNNQRIKLNDTIMFRVKQGMPGSPQERETVRIGKVTDISDMSTVTVETHNCLLRITTAGRIGRLSIVGVLSI